MTSAPLDLEMALQFRNGQNRTEKQHTFFKSLYLLLRKSKYMTYTTQTAYQLNGLLHIPHGNDPLVFFSYHNPTTHMHTHVGMFNYIYNKLFSRKWLHKSLPLPRSYVFIGICLIVTSARLQNNHSTDFHNIWWQGEPWKKPLQIYNAW